MQAIKKNSVIKLKKTFKVIISIIFVLLLICLLLYSAQISRGIQKGIALCLNIIIPSLFSFMVVSGFIMRTRIYNWLFKPIERLISWIFCVDRAFCGVVILSLIGGYPVGAKLIGDLVRQNRLSMQNAERMLCFCVNGGPAFLIGSVCIPLFNSIQIGFMIFLSHILSSIVVARLTKSKRVLDNQNSHSLNNCENFSVALVNSVNSATKSLGVICSFIIAFCAINAILTYSGLLDLIAREFLFILPQDIAQAIIIGVMEVSTGCQTLLTVKGIWVILLASGFTAFGGICVHLQVKAILNGTDIKMVLFYKMRIIYTAVSMMLTLIWIRFFDVPIEVFTTQTKNLVKISSSSVLSSVFLILLCILLLLNSIKSDKIIIN